MAEKPSMVDKVPTQLDEEELKAEMDVEIPEAMDIEETPEKRRDRGRRGRQCSC